MLFGDDYSKSEHCKHFISMHLPPAFTYRSVSLLVRRCIIQESGKSVPVSFPPLWFLVAMRTR